MERDELLEDDLDAEPDEGDLAEVEEGLDLEDDLAPEEDADETEEDLFDEYDN